MSYEVVLGLALTLLLSAVSTDAAAPDACAGAPVVLLTNSSAGAATTFYGMPGLFGAQLQRSPNATLRLAVAEPLDACSAGVARQHGQRTALLAVRGNCLFADKARIAQRAGAELLIVYDTQPGCFLMGKDNSTKGELENDIQAVSVSHATGETLQRLAGQRGTISAFMPVYSPLDWSQGLLFLMAVGTVVAGSLWAATDEAAARGRQRKDGSSSCEAGAEAADGSEPLVAATARQENISPRLRRSSSEERAPPGAANAQPATQQQSPAVADKRGGGGGGDDVMYVTAQGAVAYLFIASFVLLMLYFLLDYINTITVVLFCIGALPAIIALLSLLLAAVSPRAAAHAVALPWRGGRRCVVPTSTLVIAPLTAAAAIVWGRHRSASWAWTFQDLMGVCLVLSCLRGVRVNSLKVATILLGSMLCYDVFWVFIQPRLSNSSSVMVEVATGGASQQPLPIVLLVPALRHFRANGFAVLGLGDIALPGVLAAMCRCFDASQAPSRRPLWRGHFLPAVAAYSAGLLLTYVALMLSWFGDQGQPALLWIVPSMLTVITLSAWSRGDLKLMWHGWEGDDVVESEDSQRLLADSAGSSADV